MSAPGGDRRALAAAQHVTWGRDGMVDHAAEWHIRAAPSGEAEPDLLEEVAWWQSDDPCRPLFAAVAYIRAAAQPGGHGRAPGMPGT